MQRKETGELPQRTKLRSDLKRSTKTKKGQQQIKASQAEVVLEFRCHQIPAGSMTPLWILEPLIGCRKLER